MAVQFFSVSNIQSNNSLLYGKLFTALQWPQFQFNVLILVPNPARYETIIPLRLATPQFGAILRISPVPAWKSLNSVQICNPGKDDREGAMENIVGMVRVPVPAARQSRVESRGGCVASLRRCLTRVPVPHALWPQEHLALHRKLFFHNFCGVVVLKIVVSDR